VGSIIEADIYNLSRPPVGSDTSLTFARVVLNTALQPGQSVVVQAPWTPTSPGSLSLYAWVNKVHYITEPDYSNNIIGATRGCVYVSDGQSFSDVPTSAYFYTPVEYLTCLGVISGYADGTFRPYNTTTRGQFAKILTNGMAWPVAVPPSGGYTFADIPTTHPFFVYIETAKSRNAVSGYPCGGAGEPCDAQNRQYYRGGADIIRGDIVKSIALAKQWPLVNPANSTFQDVPAGGPYYQYVETVAAKNVISGYACGGVGEPCVAPNNKPYFRLNNTATRGQIAKILYYSFIQR
ncbi:MAG TPA: S-layer homology domain-containing protein, partial [Chloroflexia bacterium]|nr:S-layer homology domain-containing protein [Chloroflexia bacterium]